MYSNDRQKGADLEVGRASDDMSVCHNVAVSVPDGAAARALGHLLHQVQRELVPPAVTMHAPGQLRAFPCPSKLLRRRGPETLQETRESPVKPWIMSHAQC